MKKRERRTPDEARALILDAAERVFRDRLPDVAGLKDVAHEAGVSHALVTHYFGTYAGLVERTLERRFERMREVLVAELGTALAEGKDVGTVLAIYRATVARLMGEPVTMRLASWALLSGRADAADFVSHRVQGLRLLTDALEARSGLPRGDLEFALVASLAMAVVSTAGRRALGGALGRKGGLDAVEERTRAMIDAYLHRPSRAR